MKVTRCALFPAALAGATSRHIGRGGDPQVVVEVIETLRTLNVKERLVLMGVTMEEVMAMWRSEAGRFRRE